MALGMRFDEIDEAGWCVRRTHTRRLLDRYRPTAEDFTNLLCVKAPLVG